METGRGTTHAEACQGVGVEVGEGRALGIIGNVWWA